MKTNKNANMNKIKKTIEECRKGKKEEYTKEAAQAYRNILLLFQLLYRVEFGPTFQYVDRQIDS